MLIWGSKGRTKTVAQGTFLCPNCQQTRRYKREQAGRYFTLYFIPVLKTKNLGEFIECQTCFMTYKPEVLELTKRYDQEIRSQQAIETLMTELRKQLDSGVPLQAIAAGLIDSGMDQEGSAKAMYLCCDGKMRSCSACDLAYGPSVSYCSVCGTELSAAQSI